MASTTLLVHRCLLRGVIYAANSRIASPGVRIHGLLSELAAIASLPSLVGKRDAGESFEAVMEEVVKVAGLYSDYLYAVVIALLDDDLIAQLNPERVHEESDRVAAAGRIMFFELPERR
jgi:hypothetical protein